MNTADDGRSRRAEVPRRSDRRGLVLIACVGVLGVISVMGFAFAPVALSLLIAIAPLAVPFGLLACGITLMLTSAAVERGSAPPSQSPKLILLSVSPS